jgi:arachidonate 15-lipoxygenase
MGFHTSPIEQQGQYRYDPTHLKERGPARLFPFAGEDGILRYIASQLRQNLLAQGKLSQPWSLLLHQLDRAHQTLEQTWAQLTTFLVDLEIFQSGWFNLELPPDEQFNAAYVRARRAMGEAVVAARKATQSVPSGDDRVIQQRTQFYHGLVANQRTCPIAVQIHERDGSLSDREFARQRLAGTNPMMIRRVKQTEDLAPFVGAGLSLKLANGDSLDLVAAATANRLFIADYPLLQQLTAAELQPGRYVGSPIAVFHRSDTQLEPVLIQLEPGRVVTPSRNGGNSDDWQCAKLFVQVADITHHELIDHLGNTHLAMEAFAIATPRQLPANHPLSQLLRPHFQFLLAINTRGNVVLLSEGAAIDKLMAPTREASLSLINESYRQRSFRDYALPQDIQQRGIEPEFLPEFPYRDDAVLLWEAIQRYVSRYLQRYYPDDRAVQSDAYLQAWAAELGAPLSTRSGSEFPQAPGWLPSDLAIEMGLNLEALPDYARVPDFPAPAVEQPLGTIASLQQVIEIATQIIFTCGPQHAAVNFSQFDYAGYVPNAPLALYSRPDFAPSLAELLPSPTQDLGQMELTFALSGIRWGQLGSSDLIRFADAGDRQILAQFQAELTEIEAQIRDRNLDRLSNWGVDYPYLLPSLIPNSINI